MGIEGATEAGNAIRRSNMNKLKAAGIAVLALGAAAAAFSDREEALEAFVRRVKERAVPLATVDPEAGGEGLEVLKDVVGDASIVCLGESQHLMREQYRLKHRVVQYLVEEMGFTHIAIEDSLYGTIAIDDFIKGADTSPEEALQKTGGWYLWDTEEMLALVRWLRSHNDGVANNRKVSYVGLDIQDPWPGIGFLTGYFDRVDPAYASSLEARGQVFDIFHKSIWFQISAGYSGLGPSQKQAIEDTLREAVGRLEARRAEYVDEAGEKAYGDAVLVAGHLLKSHEFFLELEQAKDGDVGLREKTMFADVVRIKEAAGPGTRIVVWVHNAHAAKSPVRFLNTGRPEEVRLELMGTMLERKYGDDVRSIGMASLGMKNEGQDFQGQSDVLDHVLSGAGKDLFFLDLAGMKGRDGEEDLLAAPWKLTADMGGFLSLVPADAYDGLFFIKYVTGVRRSPEGTRRFSALF
jgi:erythromycin esterase